MVLWSPVWFVALFLAVSAPCFVRALADRLEGRVRGRTEALLVRAGRAAAHADGLGGTRAPSTPAEEEREPDEG